MNGDYCLGLLDSALGLAIAMEPQLGHGATVVFGAAPSATAMDMEPQLRPLGKNDFFSGSAQTVLDGDSWGAGPQQLLECVPIP